jgi:sugar phosphate permease
MGNLVFTAGIIAIIFTVIAFLTRHDRPQEKK